MFLLFADDSSVLLLSLCIETHTAGLLVDLTGDGTVEFTVIYSICGFNGAFTGLI